jgi:protein SCO1/2
VIAPRWTLTLALAAAACGGEPAREYPIEGQIIAVRRDTGRLTVKHGDIEGYMPGMVMSFGVADPAELDRRRPGELISATLVVREADAVLKDIKVTGRAPVDPKMGRDATPMLGPGDPVPDAEFVDDSGRPQRTADWRGSLVLVTFIYTRCPVPDFCPRIERQFLDIQEAIEDDPQLRGRTRLVTISFDPAHDTPVVLRRHAADIGALPQTWRFLTGDVDRIESFAARFGVTVIRNPEDERDITHNLRTALIGADGTILEMWSGAEATPGEIVARLRRAAADRP